MKLALFEVLMFTFILPAAEAQNPAAKPANQNQPWRAYGRVTDSNGKPMAGVEVSASCGMGSLRRTGLATSGDDGRYELNFGPGVLMATRAGEASTQVATISAHKLGYFETNLNRQGDYLAASGEPTEAQLKLWSKPKDRVFLPNRAIELNFTMSPAGRVAGRLVDEQGNALAGYSVSLAGANLPPSSSVMRSVYADNAGRFILDDIPTTFRYQFEVRMANPKPPWNDSWASAELRFERPETGDLKAWFGTREIRVQEFVIRVIGPGVHGRAAVPVAGNRGALYLATNDRAGIQEQSEKLLVAKSATLTLTNASSQNLGESLVPETVRSDAAPNSGTKLSRTKPNDKGEFTFAFENPKGFNLAPNKHQVIFQVFVGVSQKPIREKIFRQLEIRPDGHYEVPVKIDPDRIDDSRVSITFVTIQPDHATWVKTFFHDGKGTSYKGIWTSDGDLLPAIPIVARRAD